MDIDYNTQTANRIPLGANRWVELVTPNDITEAEASRVAGVILAMGIPQSGEYRNPK